MTTNHVPFHSQQSGAVGVTAKCIVRPLEFSVSKDGNTLAQMWLFGSKQNDQRNELLRQMFLRGHDCWHAGRSFTIRIWTEFQVNDYSFLTTLLVMLHNKETDLIS